jgi:hypothetical protein
VHLAYQLGSPFSICRLPYKSDILDRCVTHLQSIVNCVIQCFKEYTAVVIDRHTAAHRLVQQLLPVVMDYTC